MHCIVSLNLSRVRVDPWGHCKTFFLSSGNCKALPVIEEGFWQSLNSYDDSLECLLVCRCAAGKLYTHAVSVEALAGSLVEGPQQTLGYMVLPETTRKVKTLLSLLSPAGSPFEFLSDVNDQEANTCHLLHLISTDVQLFDFAWKLFINFPCLRPPAPLRYLIHYFQ